MSKKRQHAVYTGKELLQIEENPNEWIVEGMIPRAGRTLIFGQGASYKSTIAFDLAIAVASGRFLFSQFTVNIQGPVFLNSTEGSISKSKKRILSHTRAHDVNLAELPFYFCQQPFYIDDAVEVEELEEWIIELKPLVVVLDPLDSCFSGEENSARDTKPVRRQIDRLIDKYQTSFIIIHHQTKNTKGGATPRGSSAWYDWADAVLHVEKKRIKLPGLNDGDKLPLMIVNSLKQRDGEEGHAFSAVPHIDELAKKITFSFYGGKDHSGIINTHYKRLIYKVLRETNQPMLNKDIAMAIGVKPDKLAAALAGLEAEGLIRKDGKLERACGVDGKDTRSVEAWRAIIKRCVVDDAATMLKVVDKMQESMYAEYTINPDAGESEIEVGEPEYEANDNNVDQRDMDSIRETGDAERSRVLGFVHKRLTEIQASGELVLPADIDSCLALEVTAGIPLAKFVIEEYHAQSDTPHWRRLSNIEKQLAAQS